MAKGSFRFPLYTGGGSTPDPSIYCPANGYELPPDPAVFCPTNGYIPDEPGAGTWIHVLTMQTNSPSTTTFDPVIGSSSANTDVAWIIDGVKYNTKALSVTLDGTLKTVELWVKDTVAITSVDFRSDHIVGMVNLSHPVFSGISVIRMQSNAGLTGVIFPQVWTATSLNDLWLYSCNITGVLDLSMFDKLAASMQFSLYQNPNLNGVIFAPTITGGSVQYINIYNCDLIGTLDLSMFTSFRNDSSGFIINLRFNPQLTGVKFAPTITGIANSLLFNDAGLKYDFDLSMFTSFTANASINLQNNLALRTVSLPTSLTSLGSINQLWFQNCPMLQGTLDLSAFTKFTTTGNISFFGNVSLQNVVFPSSIDAGTITTIMAYGCTSLTSLDLSGLTSFTAGTTTMLYFHLCTNLTSITFGTSISGIIRYFRSYGTPAFINMSGFLTPTDTAGSEWDVKNNGWTAAQVNEFLSVINSLSVSGYLNRKITINGTNAAPDSTSGGFDGLAAKASLQAKEFIVTSN